MLIKIFEFSQKNMPVLDGCLVLTFNRWSNHGYSNLVIVSKTENKATVEFFGFHFFMRPLVVWQFTFVADG